jgi:spectinomycin phosphotransferase
VARALDDGWRICVADLRYAAVGGGSYHWMTRDGKGGRWFVTVDDLDDKPWLGDSRPTVLDGLRGAMDTALALRREAGLRFFAAPSPALDGETVRSLGAALGELDRPWLGGPYGEPARELLMRTIGQVRGLLARFDELAVGAAAQETVITHGEPHGANFMRAGTVTMLIDWDTTGLAPPERDLWMIVSDTSTRGAPSGKPSPAPSRDR